MVEPGVAADLSLGAAAHCAYETREALSKTVVEPASIWFRLWAPATRLLGAVYALNLMMLASILLAGMAAYGFFLYVSGDHAPALVGSLVFAASAAIVAHSGHIAASFVFVLPLFAALLLRAFDKGDVPSVLFAGASYALAVCALDGAGGAGLVFVTVAAAQVWRDEGARRAASVAGVVIAVKLVVVDLAIGVLLSGESIPVARFLSDVPTLRWWWGLSPLALALIVVRKPPERWLFWTASIAALGLWASLPIASGPAGFAMLSLLACAVGAVALRNLMETLEERGWPDAIVARTWVAAVAVACVLGARQPVTTFAPTPWEEALAEEAAPGTVVVMPPVEPGATERRARRARSVAFHRHVMTDEMDQARYLVFDEKSERMRPDIREAYRLYGEPIFEDEAAVLFDTSWTPAPAE